MFGFLTNSYCLFKTKTDSLLYYTVFYCVRKISSIAVELMGKLNIAVNYDLELYYDFFLRVDEYQNISFI